MKFGDRVVKGWELTAAGYTAVWATENTREAIWDAMKRKETYATSGSRLWLRFFGGYDFVKSDLTTRAPAIVGYRKGVPMGGDLPQAAAGKAPTFLVAAARDPYGGNLDRLQVIKGWVDKAGKTHEKIFDVAWSNPEQRKVDAQRQADAGRQHRGRRHGVVDQHDRHARVDDRLEGSGVRSRRARVLLRASPRDPDAALDRVRRGATSR